MKDLYNRNRLAPYESDAAKINNCQGGYEEDRSAAYAILLNNERKAAYDQLHKTMHLVGHIRAACLHNSPATERWRRRHADFFPAEQEAAAPFNTGNLKPVQQPKKLLRFRYWVFAAFALLFISLFWWPGSTTQETAVYPQEHYVSVESTALYSEPSETSAIMGNLSYYDDVIVSQAVNAQWYGVAVQGAEGFLPQRALATGTGEQALLSDCATRGVRRPESGEVLQHSQEGEHTLLLANPPGRDAVVRLISSAGKPVLSVYLRSDSKISVSQVPEGSYRIAYALGSEWSVACHVFLNAMEAYRDNRVYHFYATQVGEKSYGSIVSYVLKGELFDIDPLSVLDFYHQVN